MMGICTTRRWFWKKHLSPVSFIIKTGFAGIWMRTVKIKRPEDRLIFVIPASRKTAPYWNGHCLTKKRGWSICFGPAMNKWSLVHTSIAIDKAGESNYEIALSRQNDTHLHIHDYYLIVAWPGDSIWRYIYVNTGSSSDMVSDDTKP